LRVPIAREGLVFIAVPAVLAVAAGLVAWWLLAGLAAAVAVAMALFFRDPERRVAGGDASVVSPADGRLVRLERTERGTVELSIFLAPWDVHINRSPVAAEIIEAEHWPGRFLPAYRSEASLHNEQTRLVFRAPRGIVRMRQIVGVLARRIVLWKQVGDKVERGERIGLMKFGSRIDLELVEPLDLKVKLGQRLRAGESIIAELNGSDGH